MASGKKATYQIEPRI